VTPIDRKQVLLMLHGGGGSGPMLAPLTDLLRARVTLEAPNLVGHGGRPIPPRILWQDWADDVVAQMDQRGIERAVVCGYSVGGTLALHLARHHPRRVTAVCTIAAKVVFDRQTVERFTALCQPDKVISQGGGLADVLEKAHQPQDWRQLGRAMVEFYAPLAGQPPLTEDDLRAITQPALVISSVRDQIVSWDETLRLALLLPRAHAVAFPGQAHPLQLVPVRFVAGVILAWLDAVAGATDPAASEPQ
jgi:pimeloyl-ACP methyl ester carboxylesterase